MVVVNRNMASVAFLLSSITASSNLPGKCKNDNVDENDGTLSRMENATDAR